ncbi:MAG: AAA family ATPase, partial [Campylobacterota bacterium]|nr:AAA family ATPase [Campylobacterota bacterium]
MLKKLPLGITTFENIRDTKENYLYVDKTDLAYELIDSAKYYFLS